MAQFIVIHGKPIAKKRPRFARRGKFVVTYNDQQTEEGRALLSIREQMDNKTITAKPLVMRARFVFPRPKSHFGSGKNQDRLKESAPIHHIVKPDVDNCLKFIMDICTGEVWQDDTQVFSIYAEKRYCGANEQPRTEITLESIV